MLGGSNTRGRLFCLFAFSMVLLGRPAIAADPPVNLLRQDSVEWVRSTPTAAGNWKQAADESTSTVLRLQAEGGAGELLLKLSDEIATAEGWSVTLADPQQEVLAEVLGSTASPQSGFTLLRGDRIGRHNSGKRLTFRPRGAKYLLFRFTPINPDQKELAIADIAVWGRTTAPRTDYAFQESPARALDVLAQLKKSEQLMIMVSDDEASLFDDARDGKLDDWTLAEAMLIASGVTDAGEREPLLKRIDRLEAEARKALLDMDSPFQQGDALLRWLHRDEGPLSAGYQAQQTRLDVLLTDKSFNCVSSAAIYIVLARRLGLDARAIEVPDHAFAVVYDGARHADVETTNGRGFNPARDRAALKAFEKQTGLSYIPDSHRDKRREISADDLAAIIYYNRGVTLTDRKQHHQALSAYFRAMSLDPEFLSAVKNALSGLVNWGNDLMEQKQFAESVNVIQTGLRLAPKDESLRHNLEVAFTRWAVSLAEAKRHDQSLEVLRNAAIAMPEGGFNEMQATIFVHTGEEQVKAKQWREALTTADVGLSKIDDDAKPRLAQWRQSVMLRWFEDHLKGKRFEQAVAILEEGLRDAPEDDRYSRNLAFAAQEWAAALQQDRKPKQARRMLLRLMEEHPKLERLQSVSLNFARNGYVDLRDAGDVKAAREWIASNTTLLGEEEAAKLNKDLWYSVSRKPIQDKNWAKAEAALTEAIAAFPNESGFQRNLAFVVQNQAAELLAAKGGEAREQLLVLQKRHAQNSRVQDVLEAVLHMTIAKSLAANKPAATWKLYDSLRGVLPKEKDAKLVRIIADELAGPHYKAKRWAAALDAYDAGRKRLPKDRHLTNNAKATWHNWARVSMNAKDWRAAIGVYEKALQQFPDEGSFKQNIEYCQHKMQQ